MKRDVMLPEMVTDLKGLPTFPMYELTEAGKRVARNQYGYLRDWESETAAFFLIGRPKASLPSYRGCIVVMRQDGRIFNAYHMHFEPFSRSKHML